MNFYFLIGIILQNPLNSEQLVLVDSLINTSLYNYHSDNNNETQNRNNLTRTELKIVNDINANSTNEYMLKDMLNLNTTQSTNNKIHISYVDNIPNIYYNPFKYHDDLSLSNIKIKFLRFSASSIILVLLILIFCMLTYKLKMHYGMAQRNRCTFTLATVANIQNYNLNNNGQWRPTAEMPYHTCYPNNRTNEVPLMNASDYNDLPPSYASLTFDQNISTEK